MGEPKYGIQRSKDGTKQRAVVSYDGGKTWEVDPDQLPAVPSPAPAAPPAAPKPGSLAARKEELKKSLATPVDIPREPTSRLKSFGMGLLDGASLGWAADAFGLGASLGAPDVPRATGRGMDAPLDTRSTRQALGDQYRDERDIAQQDNPGFFLGGDILGGSIATAPLMAAKPLQAAHKAAPLVAGALEGAAVGGIVGAGKARSGQALEGAAQGAGQGAAVGGVLGELTGQLGPLFKRGAEKLGFASEAAEGRSSNITPPDLEKRMAEGTRAVEKTMVTPDGMEIPAGTQLKGQTAEEALAELGRTMRGTKVPTEKVGKVRGWAQRKSEEMGLRRAPGLTGSHEDLIKKSGLAKEAAVDEMNAMADALEPQPVAATGPTTPVDLSGLSKMLRDKSKELGEMPLGIAERGSRKLAREPLVQGFDPSSSPVVDFKKAWEMRQFLDKHAYDAAGQKAGVQAEEYRAMATELRKAMDQALDQAPPEVAAKWRNAMKTYEAASDISRSARKADAGSSADPGARGEARSPYARATAWVDRQIGNAPSRLKSSVTDLGRFSLERFPGTMPAIGAATLDEDLEKTRQSLPK